jgi:hypothetical protein
MKVWSWPLMHIFWGIQNKPLHPRRSDSIKKPNTKLNTSSTPKTAANGTYPSQSLRSVAKRSPRLRRRSLPRRSAIKAGRLMTHAKARLACKNEQLLQKEVLSSRHNLQRGLFTGDTTPPEIEMKQMSDYLQILESFDGIKVSIVTVMWLTGVDPESRSLWHAASPRSPSVQRKRFPFRGHQDVKGMKGACD